MDKVCVGHVAVAGGRYDEMAEDEYQTTLGYDRGGMRERLAMCLILKREVNNRNSIYTMLSMCLKCVVILKI